ncbi:MAG: DEAD/DEAH box helicase [Peptococcaceae bacterium]|nr:DEAD/DEAH box helicase [Peptococcaceae bacterium]
MNIRELKNHGVPDEVISILVEAGYTGLLDIQVKAIENGLLSGENLLIIAPTSSGKTLIGEMAAVINAYKMKRCIYIVPFKALAEEKYEDLNDKYGKGKLDLKIIISNGDRKESDEDLRVGNYDIAILTFEKLSALLVINPSIIENSSLVIIDEVQMISDEERGGRLELLLTKIREYSGKIQIIALSAVAGKLNGFDTWLGVKPIVSIHRPIELRQGVIIPDGTYKYIEWNSKTQGEESFPAREGDINQHILSVVKSLVNNGEQVVIIKNSVPSTQSMAIEYSRYLNHLPAASNTLQLINDLPETETKDLLSKTLRHSIGFHNADCELEERLAVEKGFREGEIRVIIATTTLSMGVNLPCKTVILADNRKWQFKHTLQLVPWTVGEVRNILGRAGRLLSDNTTDYGRGILFAEDMRDYRQIINTYLNASLEDLSSAFTGTHIDKIVLDIISTNYANTLEKIERFIFSMFAANRWKSEEAKSSILKYIIDGIQRCVEYELIEVNEKTYSATDLGKICASMGCELQSFNILKKYIENIKSIDTLDTIFVSSLATEVCNQYYRGVDWNDGIRKERIFSRISSMFQSGELVGSIYSMYNEAKDIGRYALNKHVINYVIALLAKDILESNHFNREITQAYMLTNANIRNICINLAWMVDVMYNIAEILNPSLCGKLQTISDCLLERSPIEARFLNSIKINLGRDDKIRLINNNFKSEDDFLDKNPQDFTGIISPRRADRIIQYINQKREKNNDFWKTDHKRRLGKLGYDVAIIENIYNVSGTDLECAIRDLFDTGFTEFNATRITDQKAGEPDLLLTFNGKKITAQVTAKESNNKFVDSKKAGDVIPQSARFKPDGYICFGRPDFQELAKENAQELGDIHNYKAIPIYVLAEAFVLVKEGKVNIKKLSNFIFNTRGYISIKKLHRNVLE